MRILACILALFWAQAEAAPPPCIQGTVHITGTIRDRGGIPLPGAPLHYNVMDWDDACRRRRGTRVEAVTDSTGAYDLVGPAGEGWLVVDDRLSGAFPSMALYSVRPRRAVLLPNEVHVGEMRLDYEFQRWRLKLHVLDREGKPLPLASVDYYPAGGMDAAFGIPGARLEDGKLEMEIGPGGYVFYIQPYPLESRLAPVFRTISIRSDTTVTVDMREKQE